VEQRVIGGAAQPIARCGEGKDCRGRVAEQCAYFATTETVT
jgi:hypothetical protein